MQKKSISLQYTEGDNINDLSEEIQGLIQETIKFASNAYAPYSNFHVSAGLVLDSGKILKGTNVENAS